ncbi:MAG: hypothetical protein ACOCV1_03060 [Bacillota bacterium]
MKCVNVIITNKDKFAIIKTPDHSYYISNHEILQSLEDGNITFKLYSLNEIEFLKLEKTVKVNLYKINKVFKAKCALNISEIPKGHTDPNSNYYIYYFSGKIISIFDMKKEFSKGQTPKSSPAKI